MIKRIKEELTRGGGLFRREVSALVEYYEAAEMEFRYVGRSGDTEYYRRLQAARAKLEAEDG